MQNSIEKIQDIQFFDSASSCISSFEKAPWTKKALSVIQSFGTFLFYSLNQISLKVNRAENRMSSYVKKLDNNECSRKLIICLHGLNNNPAQFTQIVKELEKNQEALSETRIYIPRICQRGNAKLDEMVEPIFKEIEQWATNGGEKELVLVGISNGGRISRAIEAELCKSKKIRSNIKSFRFVSIVGACKGSSLVNLAHKLHLAWLTSKNISEEMPTDSKRIEQLNRDWEDGQSKKLTREYTFIASPHDWQVPNYDSTLMEVSKHKARYAIIPGHGHNSIVNAVAKTVAKIATY